MADILFDFPIQAAPARVFDAISRPKGLDQWWMDQASGEPRAGAEYVLSFGPDYNWCAVVTKSDPLTAFELEMTATRVENP